MTLLTYQSTHELVLKNVERKFISFSRLLPLNVIVAKAISKYVVTFKQSVSVYVNTPKGSVKDLLLKPPRRVFPFCHFFFPKTMDHKKLLDNQDHKPMMQQRLRKLLYEDTMSLS